MRKRTIPALIEALKNPPSPQVAVELAEKVNGFLKSVKGEIETALDQRL